MRWGWRRLPLRSQWTLAGALLCSACVLGGFLVFSEQLEAQSERWMADRALAITRVLALAVSPALERGDAAAGQRQLELLAALPEASFGVLLREEGTPLAAWNPALVPGGPWPDATREVLLLPTTVVARLPVHTRGGPRGMLLVGLERAGLEREGARARWQASLFSLWLWLLGVGGVFGVGVLLMRPLERVTRALQRLAEGDEGVHAQVDILDALVGEAREYQERLYEQGKRLQALQALQPLAAECDERRVCPRRARVLLVDDAPWVGIGLRRALGHEPHLRCAWRRARARCWRGSARALPSTSSRMR